MSKRGRGTLSTKTVKGDTSEVEQHELTFISGNKLGKPIIVDGFKYTHNKGASYVCCICKKSVIVIYDKETNIISGIKKVNPHDEIMHSSNDKEITKRILNKQTIKKHYISNPNLSNDELARTIGYGLSSKEISRIKTNVKKDFEVPGDLVNLNIYKEIPIIQAFSSGEIVVIGQPSSLFILSQSSTILFDGTFRVVGTGEMYIVHGIYKDVCVCCLYARMLKRDQEHYIQLFNTIQHMGELRDINIFKRDIIVKSDFEYPVINAMNILYPDAHFSGCYFHLVYNIMKKLREFGLYKLYKENVTFKQFARRIRSICLLPLDYISSKTVNFLYEYNEIVLLEQYNINIKENKGYCDFKDYLDYMWFGFENGKCLFPPNMWCVKDIKIRTNNFCESSHKTINSDLKSGRIDIVQTFEAVKKNIERDQRKLSKTKCVYEKGVDLTITKTLISLRKQFDNNEIDIPNYLDLVSKLVQCENHNELRTFNARNMGSNLKNIVDLEFLEIQTLFINDNNYVLFENKIYHPEQYGVLEYVKTPTREEVDFIHELINKSTRNEQITYEMLTEKDVQIGSLIEEISKIKLKYKTETEEKEVETIIKQDCQINECQLLTRENQMMKKRIEESNEIIDKHLFIEEQLKMVIEQKDEVIKEKNEVIETMKAVIESNETIKQLILQLSEEHVSRKRKLPIDSKKNSKQQYYYEDDDSE